MIVAESSAASIRSKIDVWICCGSEGQQAEIRSMADDGFEWMPSCCFDSEAKEEILPGPSVGIGFVRNRSRLTKTTALVVRCLDKSASVAATL